MASLESRGGKYSVVFRFGGRKFTRALKTSDDGEAEEARLKVERRIRLVEDGTLTIPEGADIPDFLLDREKITVEAPVKRVSLEALLEEFFATRSSGSLEHSTVTTMTIHKRHLLRVIGDIDVEQLELDRGENCLARWLGLRPCILVLERQRKPSRHKNLLVFTPPHPLRE